MGQDPERKLSEKPDPEYICFRIHNLRRNGKIQTLYPSPVFILLIPVLLLQCNEKTS